MNEEIRFGGAGGVSAIGPTAGIPGLPATPEEFRQRYGDRIAKRPVWRQVLGQALDQLSATPEGKREFGDPNRGATLPQAWRTSVAISGIFNVCLLAQGRAATPTENIATVVLITPAGLVSTLTKGFAKVQGFSAQLFVHDGRMGHCVVAQGHDPESGRFQYLDPWPDRSLLCREFNIAGVDAQPAKGRLWEITAQELERVIFAAFVLPTFWADLTGQQYRIAYEALKQSDFFHFFRLRETGRAQDDDERIIVTLQPGGFRENIRLQLLLDPVEMVRAGTLALRRSWVVNPRSGVDMFARDIAKSFIAALLPEPDRAAAEEIPVAVVRLRENRVADTLYARRQASDLSAMEQLQLTYLGLAQESTHLFNFCRIEARNEKRKKEAWLVLKVDLY